MPIFVRNGSAAGGPSRRRILAGAVACLLLPGCGSDGLAPPDADEARRILERALAFWRDGGTIEALASADPPIVASDPRWERGEPISDFEVDGPPVPSGAQQKFRVNLRFADARGKPREVAARYEVGTRPIQTVFRAMLQ
ncbi:hypothetical protein [Paludisphaera sp.]|uniref:hypothetical protein n=1 Tax=Paludisphaera sp. TaxID=2017432 RepID=UPI00301D7E19